MDFLKGYLLSITAAALICVVVRRITAGKGAVAKLMKVITGLFMAVTLITPVVQLNFGNVEDYLNDISFDADQIATSGYELAQHEIDAIIIERVESYILDEAERIGIDLEVEVKLSHSEPHRPEYITIRGTLSPYNKRVLTEYITNNIGIPQENQIWI